MLKLVEASGFRPPEAGHEVNSWRDEAGHAVVRAYRGDHGAWIDYRGVGTFYFVPGASVVEVSPRSGARADTVADIFVRVLQPLILQSAGYEVLHASAVLVSGAVVAFAGHRHSGKSTLAHAMSHSGVEAFADDVVLLDMRHGPVSAVALPFSPRLRASARAHFGPDRDATEHLVSAPDRRPVSAPLAAIVLLDQDPQAAEHARPEALLPAAAFKRVLGYAQCFDGDSPHGRQRLVDHYLTLCTTTPVMSLRYRPSFERLPGLVDRLLVSVREACETGRVDPKPETDHTPRLTGVVGRST